MIRIRIMEWQGEYKVQALHQAKKTLGVCTQSSKKVLGEAEQVARRLCERFDINPLSVEYKI